MNGYVAIAVPPKGRTALGMLRQLADHGYMNPEDCEMLCWVLEADRKRIDVETGEIIRSVRPEYSNTLELEKSRMLCTDEQLGDLADSKPEPLKKYNGLPGLIRLYMVNPVFDSLMAYPNLNRKGRPPRFVLRQYKTVIDDVPVSLIGVDHYYSPWYVTSGDVDIGVAGFDEVAATFAGRENVRKIKRWPGFNDPEMPEIPEILGSAGLDDYCAHMIIARDPKLFKGIKFNEERFRFYGMRKVLVDQKYMPAYTHIVRGKSGNHMTDIFKHSDKVEDDVKNADRLGIAIANTGMSIGKRGLYAFGLPVLQSETLLMAQRHKYENNPDVRRVADALQYNQYTDRNRMKAYAKWFKLFKTKLNTEKWERVPDLSKMFFDDFDRTTWGRNVVKLDDIYALKKMEASLYQV